MKKMVLASAALMSAAATQAQQAAGPVDTLTAQAMQEVVVQGVRAPKNAPFAVSNIKKQDLETFSKTGQELPFLFANTPGVLAWSENGTGMGTSYMRIRAPQAVVSTSRWTASRSTRRKTRPSSGPT